MEAFQYTVYVTVMHHFYLACRAVGTLGQKDPGSTHAMSALRSDKCCNDESNLDLTATVSVDEIDAYVTSA